MLTEASGVAVSRHDPELLWAHNDSGDWSTIYAITTQGHYRGRVDILGADALDWEDIAAFEQNGKPWLLIADVGDNFGFRSLSSLYLLPEPDLHGKTDNFKLDARVARRINFRFEDGPRDVESVAVDAQNDRIYLLSKRDQPPRLYQLPLNDTGAQIPLTATKVNALNRLPGVSAEDLRNDTEFRRFRNQPTALDISADGKTWLITTYKQALIYRRSGQRTLNQVFAEPPQVRPLPSLPQVEAGALSANGQTGYFISEKSPAELVILPLAEPADSNSLR